MNCTATHCIEIANLCNGELVKHSILLIKGHARVRCSSWENGDSDKQFVEMHCCITENEMESIKSKNKTAVSHNGEFKFLVDWNDLPAGTYNLQFHFCNCQHEVSIQYDPLPHGAYRVQPLLILCSDESEEAETVDEQMAKINLNLRLVQSIYADKIRAAGFDRLTFTLNDRCRIHRSQLTSIIARQNSENELWQHFATELLNDPTWARGQEKENGKHFKFVAFIACTRYNASGLVESGNHSYANIRRHLEAHVALGGGGLALFGSAYFYAWPRSFDDIIPCLESGVKVDLNREPDESNYRRTWGGVYATTLGAVCHELGHTFDLGHTVEGVMGDGFDYLNRVFTIAGPTENLPARRLNSEIGGETTTTTTTTTSQHISKFTQLKRTNQNAFLDKYREQKENDSFYFTRNCAVILAHHRWLRSPDTNTKLDDYDLRCEKLNDDTFIYSTGRRVPLRIVEVRNRSTSLVTHFYEFSSNSDTDAPVFRFKLPLMLNDDQQYIFVMTLWGQAKRFD